MSERERASEARTKKYSCAGREIKQEKETERNKKRTKRKTRIDPINQRKGDEDERGDLFIHIQTDAE